MSGGIPASRDRVKSQVYIVEEEPRKEVSECSWRSLTWQPKGSWSSSPREEVR